MEIERHQNFIKCDGCDENTKPDLPTIRFQIALVPSHQIKEDKSIGLMREFSYYRDCILTEMFFRNWT